MRANFGVFSDGGRPAITFNIYWNEGERELAHTIALVLHRRNLFNALGDLMPSLRVNAGLPEVAYTLEMFSVVYKLFAPAGGGVNVAVGETREQATGNNIKVYSVTFHFGEAPRQREPLAPNAPSWGDPQRDPWGTPETHTTGR
ncbi:MAG: hypothetical protein A3B37_00730 [Candidatus Sungbacteria bacterium RIFCSPLOWO2_01_FULL_59_16]|uniref:Uncharacterized protein n=1 Tax=Candidatus Sungbacteria bacterium RIFCSPLOWO2_01_FULL_59_16 TaxID=1802280 RepID=A0A1G2LDI1_9BACT|nr:MAG: hypothetical protein A3B37_00730 [Candidatus Sungbacteria bacterium RIFCSPLOWO2_01_FULL_59_16]